MIRQELAYAGLTKRQNEVVKHVVLGKSNLEIGRLLFVDEANIKWHLTNIFKILKVRSRAELIAQHYQALLFQDALGRFK